jgi:BTB/POZ domain
MTTTHQNLERFFNAQSFSDVRFVFPSEPTKPVIYGHKMLLANVSSVFDKMFSGNFANEDAIVIDDIKHDIFLEIVRYIYTGQYQLTKTNMAEMLYTVQKYMIDGVKDEVEDFLLANITDDNLLEIVNACHIFESREIINKCCYIICDDPLRFFTKQEFLNLSSGALKMIVSQRQMNCTNQQLRGFVTEWQAANRHESINVSKFLGLKPFLNLETNYFYGEFQSRHYQSAAFIVGVKTPIYLHGIGLYLGIQALSDQLNQDIRESVEVVFWHTSVSNPTMIRKTIMVTQQSTTFIECVMFEKKFLSPPLLFIEIIFKSDHCRPLITCRNQQSNAKYIVKHSSLNGHGTSNVDMDQDHCLAYILTSDVENPL